MQKKDNFWFSPYLRKVFETPSIDCSEWFGYYNYDTLNKDQSKMLCGRSKTDGVAPQKGMSIELGYYDIPSGVWHHIGESDSWNWQQGAMMQWLETDDGGCKIIYNCSKSNRLISRIVDINSGDVKDLDWPIYDITPDKKKSIAIDLERSYWCRAYHYQSVANTLKDGDVYEDDGIFEIDLTNNTRRRIISIRDVINIDKREDFDGQKHWLEHIMINPSGTRFCFLHRFSPKNNVFKYETRLFIADIDGTNLRYVPGWDKVRWSHFGWCGDNAFAIYTYCPSKFNVDPSKSSFTIKGHSFRGIVMRMLRKAVSLLPYGIARQLGNSYSAYRYYKISENGTIVFDKTMDPKLSRIDGHPSFTHDESYMITDTYCDKQSWQSLYVYDLYRRRAITLARFNAFYNGNPASCDLHPKLCNDNNFIVVDTAYNEKHHMIVFQIDWKRIASK